MCIDPRNNVIVSLFFCDACVVASLVVCLVGIK